MSDSPCKLLVKPTERKGLISLAAREEIKKTEGVEREVLLSFLGVCSGQLSILVLGLRRLGVI